MENTKNAANLNQKQVSFHPFIQDAVNFNHVCTIFKSLKPIKFPASYVFAPLLIKMTKRARSDVNEVMAIFF